MEQVKKIIHKIIVISIVINILSCNFDSKNNNHNEKKEIVTIYDYQIWTPEHSEAKKLDFF